MRTKIIVSWSSGKDSAFALNKIMQSREYDVLSLLTTVTESYRRVAMHGVREDLLDLQAKAVGIPLEKILIPSPCPNEIYEAKMLESLVRWRRKGVEQVVFGDLFLEDIRAYREKQLGRIGMSGIYPVWGLDTRRLAKDMIRGGFQAILTCVDLRKLPRGFAGRLFDDRLLSGFPPGIDPCGENGEFHSFVFGAPNFKESIAVTVGETVEREDFAFADLQRAAGTN